MEYNYKSHYSGKLLGNNFSIVAQKARGIADYVHAALYGLIA